MQPSHQHDQGNPEEFPPKQGARNHNIVQHVLTENDVLMGRGSGPNGNTGNIRLRKLVWQVYLDELRASDPRYNGFSFDKKMQGTFPLPLPAVKWRIRKQVMKVLQARGAKFLRGVSQERVVALSSLKGGRKKQATMFLVRNGHRPSFYAIEATTQEAKNKIRQALRFQLDRRGEREEEIRNQAGDADIVPTSYLSGAPQVLPASVGVGAPTPLSEPCVNTPVAIRNSEMHSRLISFLPNYTTTALSNSLVFSRFTGLLPDLIANATPSLETLPLLIQAQRAASSRNSLLAALGHANSCQPQQSLPSTQLSASLPSARTNVTECLPTLRNGGM
jgi:hypothetical protein